MSAAVAWGVGTLRGPLGLIGLPDPAARVAAVTVRGSDPFSERQSREVPWASPLLSPSGFSFLDTEGGWARSGISNLEVWVGFRVLFFARSSVERRLLFFISFSEEITNPFPKEKKREPLASVAALSTESS